jgi:hypothetical protein
MLFNEAIAQLKKQRTGHCLLAILMTLSVSCFTLCGIPWLAALSVENSKIHLDVENILKIENRQYSSCVCCTLTCCFAMENKPEETDVIISIENPAGIPTTIYGTNPAVNPTINVI